MQLFYTAATPFLKLINFTVYLVTSVYQVCHYLGSILFDGIRSVVEFSTNAFFSLLLAVQVLVEDFGHFLADLYYLLTDFLDLLSYLAECCVYYTTQVPALVTDGWAFLRNALIDESYVYSTMQSGLGQVGNHVLLVKDALLLIGYCVWSFCNFIVSIFLYINEAPYIAVIFIAKWFDALFYKVYELPYEALSGLVVLSSVVYFTYKANPDLLTDCNRFFIAVLKKTKYFCIFSVLRIALFMLVTMDKTMRFVKDVYQCGKAFLGLTVTTVILKTPTKAALKIELEREKAERLCVVCLDRKRNTMLLNCKHLCMCRSCAYIIGTETGECPICRAEISEIITVYT